MKTRSVYRLTVNRRTRALLRIDPTRTQTLRRTFAAQLKRRFARLKLAVFDLIVTQDALGLVERPAPFALNYEPGQSRDQLGRFGEGGASILRAGKAAYAGATHVEHMIAEKVGAGLAKLPTSVQAVVTGSFKAAFSVWRGGQALAERVAKERGATDEQAASIRGALATADLVAFKVAKVGAFSGVPGAGTATAISGTIPVASAGYLAYSTARDPAATYRAAKGLVKDALTAARSKLSSGRKSSGTRTYRPSLEQVGNVSQADAYRLADALAAHGYDDWYTALLCAALEETGNVTEAVQVADAVYDEHPVSNALTVNDRWRFLPNSDKLAAFKDWLRDQIDSSLLSDEDLWQRYIEEGFRRGAGRAFDDTKARRFGPKEGDFYAGSRQQFLRDSFGRPEAVEKVKLLAQRTFTDLEGVTEAMSTKMVRSLADGLVQGQNPRVIARTLAADVDGIGQTRALVISRTELIRAHAEGQLTAFEQLGVEELGVAVEWSTTGDDKVCELCAPLEGVVLKIDEARGMLPRHPQ